MKSIRSMWKRGLAVCLMCVMAFMFSASPLYESHVQAAEVKGGAEYIKELRLFLKGSLKEAEAWCEKQGNGWKVFTDKDSARELDSDLASNLNLGTSGAGSINSCTVFLCYRTTTDPKEAITDIAVMNEKGNYSEGAYEKIIKDQKDKYRDLVNDMKTMLVEYRTNYNNKVPTAVTAHDYLNAYKEDDSGKLLGDLLLDISDENLTELLLQANGQIVLFIEKELAAACDTGKTTFLDRMTRLGGYDGLRRKFLTAYNNDATKADRALKENYAEKANVIYNCWNDVYNHVDNIRQNVEKFGIAGMTKEEYNKWLLDNVKNPQIFVMKQELDLFTSYKYGDGTLMDLFGKPQSYFQGDNIKELYPIVASLSKGQFAGLSECVSLFNILADSLGAAIKNNYNTGESAKLLANASSEEKKIIEDSMKELDKAEEKVLSQEPGSVYEGVDREIFKGGVAVTSAADNYSHGSEKKWAEKFVGDGDYKKWALGMGIASIGSFMLAGFFQFAEIRNIEVGVYNLFYGIKARDVEAIGKVSAATADWVKGSYRALNLESANYAYEMGIKDVYEPLDELTRVAESSSCAPAMCRYLKMGFTVVGVLLAVADITMSIIVLYNYYNRDHLPIPHHMVDLSYNENKETSYIVYKNVLDNNGKNGDMNGNCGKQWLALYATHDPDAGAPILAPVEGQKNMFVQRGSSENKDTGYSPLHMFGTPNVPQNLTFCDGENGYSFDDTYNGTYLFFRHDGSTVNTKATTEASVEENQPNDDSFTDKVEELTTESSTDGEEAEDTAVSGSAAGVGTALTGGTVALIGAAGLLAGVFIGAVFTGTRRRKLKNIEKSDN